MRSGRRSGLMVSALESGSSGLGSSPAGDIVLCSWGEALYSHGASLHPGVLMQGVTGGRNPPNRFMLLKPG